MERDRKTDMIELKKTGLTSQIIESLVLDIETEKVKLTPAEATPLVKEEDGEPPNLYFSNSVVVGMLWYLVGH